MDNINWDEIKTEYIAGDMTMRDLAKAHGVSESALFRQAKVGKWSDKRKKHRSRVVANACARAGARQSRKLAAVITSTDRLAKELEEELRDPRAFHRHVGTEFSEDGSSEIVSRDLEALNTKAIRDITHSLRELTAAIRDLYGLDTRREQVEDERADKRLALEERQVRLAEAAAEREQERDQGGVEVRIGNMPEDYMP